MLASRWGFQFLVFSTISKESWLDLSQTLQTWWMWVKRIQMKKTAKTNFDRFLELTQRNQTRRLRWSQYRRDKKITFVIRLCPWFLHPVSTDSPWGYPIRGPANSSYCCLISHIFMLQNNIGTKKLHIHSLIPDGWLHQRILSWHLTGSLLYCDWSTKYRFRVI